MAVRLNDEARTHAAELVAAGKVDKAAAWSISAEEETALLGGDAAKPDWSAYARWHLGIRTGVERATKGAYAYPYGKAGKVYRSALVAIRQRAAQQAASGIFAAAGKLLAAIDGEDAVEASASIASIGLHAGSAALFEVAPWESLPEKVFQLLPFGTVRGRDRYNEVHVYVVNERSLRSVVERHAAREDQVCFDYRHSTYEPSSELLSGIAAAWLWDLWAVLPGADLDVLATLWGPEAKRAASEWGPGVYGLAKLTERAADLIAKREFRYFSPVFAVDEETSEVLSIEGGALCNDPANGGLMPLAASVHADDTVTAAAGQQQTDHAAEPAPADPAPTTRSNTMGKIDGVDSEALSGLTGKAITDPKGLVAAVGELASERQSISQDRDRLASENAALKTRLASEEAARMTMQANAERAARDSNIARIVDEAIAQGRLQLASRDGFIAAIDGDAKRAELLVASLPAAVAKPAGPPAPAPGRITPETSDAARLASTGGSTSSPRLVWASDVEAKIRKGEQEALEAELATANPDYRGTDGFKLACRQATVRLGRS